MMFGQKESMRAAEKAMHCSKNATFVAKTKTNDLTWYNRP